MNCSTSQLAYANLPSLLLGDAQRRCLAFGLSPDPKYGDVSDLDLSKWDGDRMIYVSLGRGCFSEWGDVSDLSPEVCDRNHIRSVMLGRGSNPRFTLPRKLQ